MNLYVAPVINVFENHRNPENAGHMERYMRGQFPFLGIKTPLRRALVRPLLKNLARSEELPAIIRELWDLPEREYQLLAVDLLLKSKRKLNPKHLPLLEWLIVTKSWWDTVDMIAAQAVGPLFLKEPKLIPKHTEHWLNSGNIWLIRSAILFQLHYKTRTNEEQLFRSILQHADSEEFFIQKASGWALREYSKTAPDAVIRFIEAHELKPLCKREGLKWMNRFSGK